MTKLVTPRSNPSCLADGTTQGLTGRGRYNSILGKPGLDTSACRAPAPFPVSSGKQLLRKWTNALDYRPALTYLGLRFKPVDEHDETGDDDADDDEPAGWLGAELNKDLFVRRIKRGTPAHTAGLNVGDEVIALDGRRVRDLDAMLALFRPGETIELTVARRGELTRLKLTLTRKPEDQWKLELAPEEGMRERARRQEWLGPDR
jgi:predicted metalloprotease with PDZ domain